MKTLIFKFSICLLHINILCSYTIYAQNPSIGTNHLFSVDSGIESPVRLAIDNQDIIYVAGAYKKNIVKYNNSGEYIGAINIGGVPISIAISNDNIVYIGDKETGTIFKLNENGTTTPLYDGARFPSSMTISPSGLLYVADSELKQVLVLDTNGNLLHTIGDGILILPTGIVFDKINGRILVGEHGGIGTGFKPIVKIWVFDLEGNLIGSHGSHGYGDGLFYRIQGLAISRCGNIYAADPFQGSISLFNEDGFITKFGEYGENSGQLNAPMDILIDSKDQIWISSMNNGSLEVYSIDGIHPTSNITSANVSICDGELTNIQINLTGTPPWSLTYTIDNSNPITIDNILESPYELMVSEAGIYEVTGLSDANFTGTSFTGNTVVTVNPLPISDFTYTEDQLKVSFVNNSGNADSYIWNFGDGETNSEINPVHVYASAGEYNVALISLNEYCGNDTVNEIINILKTSSEIIEFEGFARVFPNPSEGLINIELNNSHHSNLKIEISNLKGQQIYSGEIKAGRIVEQINLRGCQEGTYVLKFITNNSIKTEKIIITK